ncbi:DUF6221 family protein [Arthrobacter sedimenti]|uniref:DUF6221 family protein n=1 Tax=Arthrobacter sedimenti TaxID=2694931 RepID=UPI000B34BEF4|nr:DUF6221 family protein [Arthrobacter sedimenti]OUM44668.1 hypothetical protein B8W73_02655 [Arthrobacter agilis]
MDELAAFILAPIEEDEVLRTGGDRMTMTASVAGERLLAECVSKRRPVAHVQSIDWSYEPAGDQDYMWKVLELLALPWARHPAYKAHWAG